LDHLRRSHVNTLLNVFGSLTILSAIGLAGSVGVETLTGSPTFHFANGQLTVTFSVLDRVLLGLFFALLLVTLAVWQKLKRRDRA
jgi:hypothetical protein